VDGDDVGVDGLDEQPASSTASTPAVTRLLILVVVRRERMRSPANAQ
jgi:hypothetical protein